MAGEWRGFEDETKQKYRDMEKIDKDRYAADKVKYDKYIKAHPEKAVAPKKRAGSAKKGVEGGPKRSTSAFFFF